ncbi:MAG TPA: GNAT family N-acetyltransferase [Caulobacteraceae bacterium]|nr:GNAT family N-acetyltransferase [Caulobacteraceae bacterium]
MSPPDLLTRRVETLYETDARGRLVRSNEWDARPAPRLHVMFTADGPICRFRGDVPDDLALRLEDLCRRAPPAELGPGLPEIGAVLIAELARHAPVRAVWCGPAYRLPEGAQIAGRAVAIDPANAALLAACFPDWIADASHRQPFVAVVEGGRAVALCASVRISGAVHCAGVETHADHRRRGHAASAVGAWAAAAQALGATPFYSTAWENIASQRVAARLGFELVGVDFHVT